MSKKTILILIIIIILVIGGGLGYLYISKSNTSSGGTNPIGINFLSTFFPFSKTNIIDNKGINAPFDVSGLNQEESIKAPTLLKKVSSFPIAGYGVYLKERFIDVPVVIPAEQTQIQTQDQGQIVENTTTKTTTKNTKSTKNSTPMPTTPPTEFVPALRYTDRAAGKIYQTFADKIEERKLSDATIPQVYEAYFGKKSESVIMRYLQNNTIETFVKALSKEILGADSTQEAETAGIFLPENITDITMSPDYSKMFYLFNNGNYAVGIVADQYGNNKSQVFSSPYTEWLTQWPNDKMITLTTKPSYAAQGYMYAVDPNKKDFIKILGGISGLTTLTSPNGKLVLYSNSNLDLSVLDVDTKISRNLGVRTLPEKCVWSKASDFTYCAIPQDIENNQYPDSWYQGITSFSDQIWQIDTNTGSTVMILDPSGIEGGEAVDAIKLSVDENQDYLFFVNKKDSYLWEFDL